MSRQPRAGTAGKPVTIRATDEERKEWLRVARIYRESLSDLVRRAVRLFVARHEHISSPSPPARSSSSKKTRSRR